MRSDYPILFVTVIFAVLACTGGPPPPSSPRDIRISTRYLNKGVTLYERGCFQQALAHFYESHERFSAVDDLQGVANSLHSIANTYLQMDDPDSALMVYREAIDDYRMMGDDRGQARAWANYALAWIETGHLEKAEAALDRADALVGPSDDLMALRNKNRALLLVKRQQPQAAEKLLAATLPAAPEEDPATVAGMYYLLGELQLQQNDPGQAATHLLKALDLDRSADAYYSIARDLAALGVCYTRLERYAEAANYQERSAKIYALLNDPEKVQAVMQQLEANAKRTQTDIRSTLHWVNQWLAGKKEANLCR